MAARIVACINTLNLLLLNLSIYFSEKERLCVCVIGGERERLLDMSFEQQLSNALGYFWFAAALLFVLEAPQIPSILLLFVAIQCCISASVATAVAAATVVVATAIVVVVVIVASI